MKIFNKILFFSIAVITVLLSSCGNTDTITSTVDSGTLLFDSKGLVDSAVVYGCYSITRRTFLPDTIELNNYSKLKITFDGNTNSNGTIIFIYFYIESENSILAYRTENLSGINDRHSFEVNKPAEVTWAEVRLYINPPVCGENEFKYNRVRDLRIYGVK